MRAFPAVLAALFFSGCMTTQVQYAFVRLDGRPTEGNAELAQQLETDRTICFGEGQKANLSGTVVSTGHLVGDMTNDISRMQSTNTVIVGCMASRGYKYVAVPVNP